MTVSREERGFPKDCERVRPAGMKFTNAMASGFSLREKRSLELPG